MCKKSEQITATARKKKQLWTEFEKKPIKTIQYKRNRLPDI